MHGREVHKAAFANQTTVIPYTYVRKNGRKVKGLLCEVIKQRWLQVCELM